VLLAFAGTGLTAHAQGVTQLEGITVYSANRTPTEASKVGSTVEVLTEKDLEKQSQTYVKDYLQQLPGINFTQNGPPGSSGAITIRGATTKYVKVLVDGIDISDPTGVETIAYFEHLLVGDVARIEVVKGSQSTLYGGDAVAGLISIETKKATKPGFSASGGAEYGAYDTRRGAVTAGYASTGGSNVSFTAQGLDTKGFSSVSVGTEDDGYENVTLSGRGEIILSPAMKIFFAGRSLDAESEFDFGFFPFADNEDYSTIEQQAGRVGTEIALFDGAFVNTFAVQGMQIQRDVFGSNPGWFDGDRVKGEYQGVLTFNDRLSLLAGADWEQTTAETASSTPLRNEADVTGYFAQLMMEPIDGLVLTGGARMDEHSTFGDFNTYRLTAAYLVPGTETKLRASRGTGFRAPSLDELYGAFPAFPPFVPAFLYGNEGLTPEESKSWDAGIEQGFMNGRVRVGATYFELDTENLIDFDNNCFFLPVTCYTNLPGITRRSGVELTGSALITQGLAISTAYTYTDTEQPNGDRLVRVPRHNFVVGVDLSPMDKLEINVTAKYVADILDEFRAEIIPLDDYVLVSAKASYEFLPGWKGYVRGENLLDEDYETITGYATSGLAVYGGVTMVLPDGQ